MILSYDLFIKLEKMVKDDCLIVETSSDDILIQAFETGRATGKLEIAKQIINDLFGNED